MTMHVKTSSSKLKIRQLGSAAGLTADQKATLLGLGLRKINHLAVLEDTPSVRGMIRKVRHLVRVEQ